MAHSGCCKFVPVKSLTGKGCAIVCTFLGGISAQKQIFISLYGSEGLLERWTLRSEQLSAVFGDVHIVFQPYSEFAADVNARFIAEDHVGYQGKRVAVHEIWPLMSIHAHAVSDAVSEILINGTKAGITDNVARDRIHNFTGSSWPGSRQCCALCT